VNFTYKQAVILFIVSMVVVMVGLLFKIQHWPHGSFAIGAGLIAQLCAIILLIVLLVKRK
jgi:exosortase/archaeosortase